jgi:HK97 family phage portal protein
LETRRFQVIDIARIFRVPPHKLAELGDAHYANLEQSEIAYVKDALAPIAKRIEEHMDEALLFQDEAAWLSLRFEFDELMRGDTQSRYAAYATGLQNGILSVNEVRAKEGLASIGRQGDKHRVPLNTGSLQDVNPESAPAVTAPKDPAIPVPPAT